jgi:hypothetical protein
VFGVQILGENTIAKRELAAAIIKAQSAQIRERILHGPKPQ